MGEIIPKSRVFINKRDRAFRIMRMLNAEGSKTWLVGVSSQAIPMFDVEKYAMDAIAIALFLKEKFKDRQIGIFQSDKGCHVVLKAILTENEFRNLYEQVKKYGMENNLSLDYRHIDLTLKYNRTTLRITPKPFRENSKPPRLIQII